MIPIHHGTFALSYETLADPSRWLAELVHERGLKEFVVELEPGQSRVFVPPRTQARRLQHRNLSSILTPAGVAAHLAAVTSDEAADSREVNELPAGIDELPYVPAFMRMRLYPPEPRVFVPTPESSPDIILGGATRVTIDIDAAVDAAIAAAAIQDPDLLIELPASPRNPPYVDAAGREFPAHDPAHDPAGAGIDAAVADEPELFIRPAPAMG